MIEDSSDWQSESHVQKNPPRVSYAEYQEKGIKVMTIGDKVKVLTWNPENDPDVDPFEAGTIGVIVEDKSKDPFYDNPYRVKAHDKCWWYKAKDLEVINSSTTQRDNN